ncbi:hypothetical protein [Polyangium sp. 15x6]|uniref:hypothetical protein n=1 Tax=Polyangium sp. 15x6 TaxID=3042687 RepID=UPI00249B9B95|nr:hypothetical protein [Polyangium sp. 15x6]MDI3286839.1 hypothetical protein [Polyangium sp. 15x6]
MAEVSDNKFLKLFAYVTLDFGDSRRLTLQKLLFAYEVEWQEDRWDEYTDEEFEAAPLIVAIGTSEIFVFGGPRFGTDYDISTACPACGAGMRQTAAYVLDGSDAESMGKLRQFRAVSTYGEILVDERLAETLENAGLSGLSFRSVYAKQKDMRQTQLPWMQMWAPSTLPPMSSRSTGVERGKVCKSCGRSKYNQSTEEPLRLAYHARDLVGAQDVNRMWERFGIARWNGDLKTAVVSQPDFLVTPKASFTSPQARKNAVVPRIPCAGPSPPLPLPVAGFRPSSSTRHAPTPRCPCASSPAFEPAERAAQEREIGLREMKRRIGPLVSRRASVTYMPWVVNPSPSGVVSRSFRRRGTMSLKSRGSPPPKATSSTPHVAAFGRRGRAIRLAGFVQRGSGINGKPPRPIRSIFD